MAKAILGGIAAVDKSSSETFNTPLDIPVNVPSAPGDRALLAETLRAGIARLVHEQVGIAMGALVAALRGDSTTGVAHEGAEARFELSGRDAMTPGLGTAVPSLAASQPAGMNKALWRPIEESASSAKLCIIPTEGGELQPLIFAAEGTDRSALGREPALQRPGIYIGLWENKTAYVGMGKRVGQRAATNDRVSGANRILCITDAHGRMTAKQALVCERLLAQVVRQHGGLELVQSMPVGAPIEPQDYDAGRLFVAHASVALRQAGLLFTHLPAAALLLPPTQRPALAVLNEGAQVFAIAAPDLRAHLTEHPDGWVLLQGSEVRIEVRASAYGPAAMLRAELLHTGALLHTGSVLTSTQDLVFSSAWSAAHFVLGEKPRSDVWKPMAAPIPLKQPSR